MNIVSFFQTYLTEIFFSIIIFFIILSALWYVYRANNPQQSFEESIMPRMLSDEELDSLEPDQRYRMVEGQ